MRFQTLEKCIGLTLGQDIKDDNDILILGAGVTIMPKHVARLKNFGIHYLCIDDDETSDIDTRSAIPENTVKDMKLAVVNIDIDKAFTAASKMVDDMLGNLDLIENGYMDLRKYDENTYVHSLNVAIFSVMLGIALGLNTTRLNNLAVGGMLHDIGKTQVPIEILNKAGRLTESEIAIIRMHPENGYKILKDDVLIPSSVKAIVYQHHENWNGSGYPRKLSGESIYELASICHICDVFDALISKRAYKEAFSYQESLDYIESQRGIMFSPYCLDYFFQYVPIFKAGTTVSLNNGKEAIVVKNNRGSMRRPTIRILSEHSDIDLRTVSESELHIVS